MITKDWRAAARSWCFPMSQKPYRSVALEKRQETESDRTCTCSIIDTLDIIPLEGYSSTSKQQRNTKLGFEVEGFVGSIEGPASPLLVILYTYSSSASNYTHHPNIHCLLTLINFASGTPPKVGQVMYIFMNIKYHALVKREDFSCLYG